MADATYTLSASGADKVTHEMQRAEKAVTKTRGATMKGGMAMLDFSRGFEDFAVAGMRGAMNNIPTVMTNLGVGAGLTGILAMTTVAVWKGVDAWEAYLNKMHKIKEDAAAVGLAMVGAIPEGFLDENKAKGVDAMTEAMRKSKANTSSQSDTLSMHQTIEDKERELEIERELLRLKESGASAEAEKSAKRASGLKSIEEEYTQDKEAFELQQMALGGLKRQAEELQKIVDAKKSAEAIKFNSLVATMKSGMFNAALSRLPESAKTPDVLDKLLNSTNAKVNKQMEEKGTAAQKEFLPLQAQRIQAIGKLEVLQKEIDAQETLVGKEAKKLEAAKAVAELQKESLQIATKMEELDAKEKERKEAMASFMGSRADVSQMLSSQGQSGLAANEVRSAMETLNIFKQQLSTLKTIARNTGRRTFSYA